MSDNQPTTDELREMFALEMEEYAANQNGVSRTLINSLFNVALARAEAAERDVAALRARLAEAEAGEGWRPVSEEPMNGDPVQVLIDTSYEDWRGWRLYFPFEHCRMKWRPAPGGKE